MSSPIATPVSSPQPSSEGRRGTSIAEFDEFARGYDAGMSHPLMRLCGRSAEDFLRPKARWLLNQLASWSPSRRAELRLLDLGCGTGTFLAVLRRLGFQGELYGGDVSPKMLAEAARRWPDDAGNCPRWELLTGHTWPYADETFDCVVCCCVLHHVSQDARDDLFREASRVLRPGGQLVVFEHNPWHPLTQLVVRTMRIDRHAVLLSVGEIRKRATRAALIVRCTEYLLFLPPRWKWAERVDRWCRHLPCGGQYVVVAQKT